MTGFKQVHPSKEEMRVTYLEHLGMPVTDVLIVNGVISADYDGRRLASPVKAFKHLPHIGDWKHTFEDEIKYDLDVKKKNLAGLLVHELVEQYLQKDLGLTYALAHKCATSTERIYVEQDLGLSWKGYQASVLGTKI